jgi:hypothetical protein
VGDSKAGDRIRVDLPLPEGPATTIILGIINRRNRDPYLPAYRREDPSEFGETPQNAIDLRLEKLAPIHAALAARHFTNRLGQALEIAVFKALKSQALPFFGNFVDLDAHGDDEPYIREDPPSSISGNAIPGKKTVDFILIHPSAGPAAIKVKNVREWLYPDREEILELLLKSCSLRAIPVLVARRIPYVTFSELHSCGVILHQTYNQLYPNADRELAAKASHKDLLGFHDIRVGNDPDGRLLSFIHTNLPALLPESRARFDASLDLLTPYAERRITRADFIKELRLRRGEPDRTELN